MSGAEGVIPVVDNVLTEKNTEPVQCDRSTKGKKWEETVRESPRPRCSPKHVQHDRSSTDKKWEETVEKNNVVDFLARSPNGLVPAPHFLGSDDFYDPNPISTQYRRRAKRDRCVTKAEQSIGFFFPGAEKIGPRTAAFDGVQIAVAGVAHSTACKSPEQHRPRPTQHSFFPFDRTSVDGPVDYFSRLAFCAHRVWHLTSDLIYLLEDRILLLKQQLRDESRIEAARRYLHEIYAQGFCLSLGAVGEPGRLVAPPDAFCVVGGPSGTFEVGEDDVGGEAGDRRINPAAVGAFADPTRFKPHQSPSSSRWWEQQQPKSEEEKLEPYVQVIDHYVNRDGVLVRTEINGGDQRSYRMLRTSNGDERTPGPGETIGGIINGVADGTVPAGAPAAASGGETRPPVKDKSLSPVPDKDMNVLNLGSQVLGAGAQDLLKSPSGRTSSVQAYVMAVDKEQAEKERREQQQAAAANGDQDPFQQEQDAFEKISNKPFRDPQRLKSAAAVERYHAALLEQLWFLEQKERQLCSVYTEREVQCRPTVAECLRYFRTVGPVVLVNAES